MKHLKVITVVVLVLSLLGHLLLWGYTSQWTFGSGSGYSVFALLPPLMLLLYIATPSTKQETTENQVSLCVTSLFIGPYPVYVYYDTLFSPLSSTSALVFFILPIYCFIAMPFIYLITKWLYLRLAARRQ
jgi:cytochrome bd-type quinol oxidase subunit 2